MHRTTRVAISWCFKNDIKIIVKPLTKTRNPDVKLEIHILDKIQIGEEIYRQDLNLYNKIEELYLYLYNTKK
jgi:hypothetical protein|tara:strand:- start:95 stop:310 length:216 start_codon:yes stop_codon:yes gene_type:complete